MKIIVEAENLMQIAETIQHLPVNGGFEAADKWVGCVIALTAICQNSEPYKDMEESGE